MAQLLLFPDPRPLVERLGGEFFRQAPESPGVYLMRDRADTVLYVGKAKNLRQRLASYRVANPDRLRRRHLRLLRAVERIELQPCASESSALAKESALLRSLRPRFNRAGTWPGNPRFVVYRLLSEGLELGTTQAPGPEWQKFGPLGMSALHLCAALARLIWCALHPDGGVTSLPQGWFGRQQHERSLIPRRGSPSTVFDLALERLRNLFAGDADGFGEWIRLCTSDWTHPFDLAVRDADLETVTDFANKAAGANLLGQVRIQEI